MTVFRTREKKRQEESETARKVEELREENEKLERQVVMHKPSWLISLSIWHSMGDGENSAKFARVVRDCAKTSTEAVENVEKFLAALKNTGKDLEGISLLDVKNREMISYMAELSLLMSHISCGKSISEHPAVFRASKHRTVSLIPLAIILERIRPIEQKMKSQIDRLTQGVHNGELKAPPRARPDQMEEKSRRKYEADKERERFEEDHFVRLRMSKAEKKRERLQNRDNAIDDLFNFGNYMMRDESGEALSYSKKRKASRTGGPRGKKSRFDRKKSQKLKAKSKVQLAGCCLPYYSSAFFVLTHLSLFQHKAIKRRQ
ncbi:Sas10/Utp3/C1D family protein [Ancylostoma duodenale]|uniref:Sas10/Utp3/C1D family protein n=1 Tax=Ancylostoma duodenale TaxID=51022 RepID=A0A0C2G6X4_9BILA|nr:Sas10/Utp3/C1D family protein [Ancylostoma duodenale]